MTGDHPPTIFGSTLTWRMIFIGGIIIAALVGLFTALARDPMVWLVWLFVPMVVLLVISAAARLIFRRKARPTRIVMLGVAVKLANMVAIAALSLMTLVAFAIGSPSWQNLAKASLSALVLGAVISAMAAITANLGALFASPSPPSTPPA